MSDKIQVLHPEATEKTVDDMFAGVRSQLIDRCGPAKVQITEGRFAARFYWTDSGPLVLWSGRDGNDAVEVWEVMVPLNDTNDMDALDRALADYLYPGLTRKPDVDEDTLIEQFAARLMTVVGMSPDAARSRAEQCRNALKDIAFPSPPPAPVNWTGPDHHVDEETVTVGTFLRMLEHAETVNTEFTTDILLRSGLGAGLWFPTDLTEFANWWSGSEHLHGVNFPYKVTFNDEMLGIHAN